MNSEIKYNVRTYLNKKKLKMQIINLQIKNLHSWDIFNKDVICLQLGGILYV